MSKVTIIIRHIYMKCTLFTGNQFTPPASSWQPQEAAGESTWRQTGWSA